MVMMDNLEEKSGFNATNAVTEYYKNLSKKDTRPNILILMTDQQRYDTIKAHGYPHMYTPNLDKLAAISENYTNAYTPNPICCPARHNFITGVSSKYHGIADNDFAARLCPDIPVFPRLLSHSGYQTAAIGKMHFQPMREHHGFERLKLMEEVPEYREDDDYAMFLKENGYGNVLNIHGVRNLLYMLPQRSVLPKHLHGTKWVADEGISFLEENSGKRPFLLYLSWIAPHPPFNAVEDYAEMYKGQDIPMPAKSETSLSELSEENKLLGDLPTDEYIRRMREVYYGMISHVDEHVGRVIDKLDEIGQLDNTIIFFTTDHGEMLGDHGLYQKWLPYDAATRIPFMVKYPKGIEPAVCEKDHVDLNDIFPTVLDIAGVDFEPPYPLMGESLISEDKKKNREIQYVSYSQSNRRWCSLTDQKYKYNYYYGGGREELFDLRNDPHETTNLLEKNRQEFDTVAEFYRKELVKQEIEHWDEDYIDDDGTFKVLSEYTPNPNRNIARPQYPKHLVHSDEISEQNNFVDEVIEAMKDESVVKAKELDYKAWAKNLDISDDELNKVLMLGE
ncbi:arylsulfatase [Vibrio aquaticus]|uniref:Arylsulfatase n=2 Tax=Vibrio aquaticus TaxID=2496559 RepID=A0A432D2H0_9VIBR|nr:arylsulfatase [Vibrio aquaticus]